MNAASKILGGLWAGRFGRGIDGGRLVRSTSFPLWPVAAVVLAVAVPGRAAEVAAEGRPHLNHLAAEKSPYLREHATNPVEWYPWGEEAFARARREQKPIFLSIGYSTCHWCHVMARESFENPEIAALLNANFVCIKVDREERPDIDRIYMAFVQASTGSGGWPMTVWLTPELKPFLGGTYFPPENRGGLPGLKVVASRVAELWRTDRELIVKQAAQMLQELGKVASEATGGADPANLVPIQLRHEGMAAASHSFDPEHGGFERAPKFPGAVTLEFLLDLAASSSDRAERETALQMVLKTLREIVAGGVHDQLGGGFHRYAVDERWRLPHFEKMLYDQAQLTQACLTAWQLTGDRTLRAAVASTLDYVRERLTDPAGGFYTAEDADSASAPGAAKREGAFYLWSAGEIENVLGPDDAAVFNDAFGVEARGNVAAESGGELFGENVLFRARSGEELAHRHGMTPAAADKLLRSATAALQRVRAQRPRPARDDKIVASWNGLMISAYARAAQICAEPDYATMAARAAGFVREKMFDPASGKLSRSYRAGVRDARAFAEDYACMVQGLLDLYEATFDVSWLKWAIELQEKQDELFWDDRGGGYFASDAEDRSVLLRLKEDNEASEPAASSLAVRNLARLAEMLHRDEWWERARRTALGFLSRLQQTPLAMPQMLASIGWLEGSPQLILIHGEPTAESTMRLIRAARQQYLPRRVMVRIDSESRAFFAEKVELVRDLPPEKPGSATAYVCRNFVCEMPTSDADTLRRLLVGKAP